MYTPPSAPRSIGAVIDDTIQLYKSSFSACVLASVFLALLALGFQLYSQPHLLSGQRLTSLAQLSAQASSRMLRAYVVYIPLLALGYLVMLVRMTALATGKAVPPLGAAISRAAGRLPATIGAGILFILAVTVGTILLIIPGIYIWNRLQLYVVPLVIEGTGVMDSLDRSWRLVKGHWWRTATIFTVILIIILVLDLLVAPLMAALVAILRPDILRALLFTQLMQAAMAVFTTPLLVATLVAIYCDLRLRLEGADIEARVGDLQRS